MVNGGPLKMNTNACSEFSGNNFKGSEPCSSICLCISDEKSERVPSLESKLIGSFTATADGPSEW
jgi:hypothetical protein